MNNAAYTAYPSEREILFQDGSDAFVLSIEDDVAINVPDYEHESGKKTITVIHLH